MRRALAQWSARRNAQAANVFLCGVTPEIATMDWPFDCQLIGMDQSESMVRVVWPGDVVGVRQAVVGSWMKTGLPPHSRDVVIGDGGMAHFAYPDGQRRLIQSLSQLLKPGGLFVYRHFAQGCPRETVAEVLDAARSNQIGNFHIFKWRLAMSLQTESGHGVRQHDVWQACRDADLDATKLPQPGWSTRAVETIRFYEGKDARLYFPTIDEFRAILAESFEDVEVAMPTYELGERCPTLTARVPD